jgi:magnesium transporter
VAVEDTSLTDLLSERNYSEIREFLSQYPVPDIADMLLEVNRSDRVILFRLLPRSISSEVFSYLKSEDQNELLKALSEEETRNLLVNLRPDDRTVLFEELPGRVTQKLLNLLTPEELKQTRQLLGYPEESVGRLMTPDYVAVRPQWTVKEALDHIRLKCRNTETLNSVYITDENWLLTDTLDLHRFILASPDHKVEELMDKTFVSINAFEDREAAVHALQRYDVIALPVVDSDGILLGIVTFDDVMDVAEAEATEDFHKGAAVTPLKTGYQETSIWELYSKRIVWLLTLVFVNMISMELMSSYEEVLAATIALTFFIPMLIGSGGNAGAQSATLMVRALATGDIETNQWLVTLGKEMAVGASLGLTMGVAGFFLGWFKAGWDIALIVGLTMVAVVIVANMIGVLLPFLLTRLNLDPAVASNPLIASLADVAGLFIYFIIATWILTSVL